MALTIKTIYGLFKGAPRVEGSNHGQYLEDWGRESRGREDWDHGGGAAGGGGGGAGGSGVGRCCAPQPAWRSARQSADGAAGAPVTTSSASAQGVAPAGVDKKGTGHHHIFLDRPAFGKGMDGADELAANIPADENHLHFGGGQTETTLNLKPGRHSLQLVLGDKDHIPHDPPVVSQRITITVK